MFDEIKTIAWVLGDEALRRAAYWAGRAAGAVDQVRDAAEVALLPLAIPQVSWPQAARFAVLTLRGHDPRPLLRARNAARSVAREAAAFHEAKLREHFERARAGRGTPPEGRS